MSNWRIVFDPIWPFGPSAKDQRIAGLEVENRKLNDYIVGWRRKVEEMAADRALHDQARDEAQRAAATLEARVEHQKAELAAVHRHLERALDSQDNAITLCDTLIGKICELRRDGFNPDPAGRPYPAGDDAKQFGRPVEEKVDEEWLRITEAAQERGGGSPGLYDKLMADATRWRAKGLATKEIVQRIYEGFES